MWHSTAHMNSYHDLSIHLYTFFIFFFFRNIFEVSTCCPLQITNHLSEIITFHLQVALRKQDSLFATAAVIISEMFGPPVNQIARYKRSSCKRKWSWLRGEGSETGKFGIKEVEKGRITTVKRLQKAEISSVSSSSVQMTKHQVRRLFFTVAIWHLSSCLVTRFLRGKIIKQIHTQTLTPTHRNSP